MIHLIMDNCILASVNVPRSNDTKNRTYIKVVDLDFPDCPFEFSTEAVKREDVYTQLKKMGRLEGDFELFTFSDRDTGAKRVLWKSDNPVFKPLKVKPEVG